VSTGGARLHLVAVRSHFGLRLDGRNNPARASNRPGRRIIAIYSLSLIVSVTYMKFGELNEVKIETRVSIFVLVELSSSGQGSSLLDDVRSVPINTPYCPSAERLGGWVIIVIWCAFY
jgi:hypothetical protein